MSMVDLSTEYLGLKLANPLVPSASPLSRDLDMARRLEDAGAAALVMYSLFEETIHHEERQMQRFLVEQGTGFAEAGDFFPEPPRYSSSLDDYLAQLAALKASLDIPVIASLNGVSGDGWITHGRSLQDAGADALELNVYYIAADPDETAEEVEQRYVSLLQELKEAVNIPVTLKLSHQFSALGNMVRQLEQAGADGVALFNRFYQPDIDLETLQVRPALKLSDTHEALLRIRWVALLYGRVKLSLAVTGGLHTAEDVLKALLAGADVTHLCSTLLQHGPGRLTGILDGMRAWMEEKEYEAVSQLKGSVSQQHAIDPGAYERANYLDVLDSYSPSPGVLR
jgi:dihydroorotate dehydrogenase (fumarate)